MLLLLTLSSVLRMGTACQKIPLYYGTLESTLVIPGATRTDVSSSCKCCALCHHEQSCKSFSYRPASSKCTMYREVGGYPTFNRQAQEAEDTEFYVMPRRSTTDEFCLQDSDCLNGEPCMARVCTWNTTITCLTIKELNPTTNTHTFWGAVNGTELRLSCMMETHGGGWTLLVDALHSFFWQEVDVRNYSSIGDGPTQKMGDTYSALWAADLIRDSRPGDYKVIVTSRAPESGVLFTAPRARSLLGSAPVEVQYTPEPGSTSFSFSQGDVVFPYMLKQTATAYHMNKDQTTILGSIMRNTGSPRDDRWSAQSLRPHTIQVWIKEGQ